MSEMDNDKIISNNRKWEWHHQTHAYNEHMNLYCLTSSFSCQEIISEVCTNSLLNPGQSIIGVKLLLPHRYCYHSSFN